MEWLSPLADWDVEPLKAPCGIHGKVTNKVGSSLLEDDSPSQTWKKKSNEYVRKTKTWETLNTRLLAAPLIVGTVGG